jgi:hypothetical protein
MSSPRIVNELDDDRLVWTADTRPNRSMAHLDEDCQYVHSDRAMEAAYLHPQLPICNDCDGGDDK